MVAAIQDALISKKNTKNSYSSTSQSKISSSRVTEAEPSCGSLTMLGHSLKNTCQPKSQRRMGLLCSTRKMILPTTSKFIESFNIFMFYWNSGGNYESRALTMFTNHNQLSYSLVSFVPEMTECFYQRGSRTSALFSKTNKQTLLKVIQQPKLSVGELGKYLNGRLLESSKYCLHWNQSWLW